jgi:TRAP-type uncharacterized transport system substrate-binding protein
LHPLTKAPHRIAVAVSLAAILAAFGVASVFAAAPSSVTIGTGSNSTLGTFLTGPNGHTLTRSRPTPTTAVAVPGNARLPGHLSS